MEWNGRIDGRTDGLTDGWMEVWTYGRTMDESVYLSFHFRYDADTDTVSMSFAEFKSSQIRTRGRLVLFLFKTFGLIHCETFTKDNEDYMRINNLTLINFCLKIFGPMHEKRLTILLLGIQVICSIGAFLVRFLMASLVYDVVH